MALDKNEFRRDLERALKKLPKIPDHSIPDGKGQIEYLDEQIDAFKKVVLRYKVETSIARSMCENEDSDVKETGLNNLEELTPALRGALINLSALKQQRFELEEKYGKNSGNPTK